MQISKSEEIDYFLMSKFYHRNINRRVGCFFQFRVYMYWFPKWNSFVTGSVWELFQFYPLSSRHEQTRFFFLSSPAAFYWLDGNCGNSKLTCSLLLFPCQEINEKVYANSAPFTLCVQFSEQKQRMQMPFNIFWTLDRHTLLKIR